MSHDFRVEYRKTGKPFVTKKPCNLKYYGGTIRVELDPQYPNDISKAQPAQITEFNFNTTYNYTPLIRDIGMEDGINTLYDKDLNECMKILLNAIYELKSKYHMVFNKDFEGRDPEKKKYNKFLKCDVYDIPKKRPSIKQMALQNDIIDDYWACTPNNVFKALDHILTCLCWIKNNTSKKTYENLTIRGD
jgi:hypothetical protein